MKISNALVLCLFSVMISCESTIVEINEDQHRIYQQLFRNGKSDLLATMPFCYYVTDGKATSTSRTSNYTSKGYLQRLLQANSSAIEINYGVRLLQLIDLNEKEQSITVSIQMEMRWTDCRLMWSAAELGSPVMLLSVESFRSSNLFVPSVKLLEEVNSKASLGSEVKVGIRNDGNIYLFREYSTTFSCDIDVTMYPFDIHVCTMTFEAAYHRVANALLPLRSQFGNNTLRISRDLLANGRFMPSYTWDISVLPPKRKSICSWSDECQCVGEEEELSNCLYDRLVYTLILRRHPHYQLANLILPAFLVTIISGSVFLIPPGEADKMGLSVTILLSLFIFTQLMYDNMPDTGSNVPLTSRYYMLCVLVVAISCIYSTISATMQCSATPVPPKLQRVVRSCCKSFFCGIRGKSSVHHNNQHNPQNVTNGLNQLDENNDDNDTLGHSVTWHDVTVFFDRCFLIVHFVSSCFAFLVFLYFGYGPWKRGSRVDLSAEDMQFIATQLDIVIKHD